MFVCSLKVTSIDWRSYRQGKGNGKTLSLGTETPKIDIVLINRPEARAFGAAETSVTVVAAAVGNAFFDATGVRLRQVPSHPSVRKNHSR